MTPTVLGRPMHVETSAQPFRILLLKPYQPVANYCVAPPLGLLYLASALRHHLGDRVQIRLVDAKLARRAPEDLREELVWADLVGISALNYEASVSFRITELTKAWNEHALVALGGPFTHGRGEEILHRCSALDWLFDGESERTFIEAITNHLDGLEPCDIPGLYRFRSDGTLQKPNGNDFITDLDSIPFPAWDLIDFDAYARAPNMNAWLKGRRYAAIFTSRGCPYKCSYCHDIFTKKFRWRSAENVLAEISLLAEGYGVDEFQIIDDIFNLHKPRLHEIFAGIETRHGLGKFHFCFPNGLRGDILDPKVIQTLKRGGAYQITVAIETATPRIQRLIQKNLDIAKVRRFIDYCHAEGILVKGYFMLGFPGESKEELKNTIRFALRSRLTFASFFTVIPQPGTPLHALAAAESPTALAAVEEADYHASRGFYELATGYPLGRVALLAILRFYFGNPARLFRILRHVGIRRSRSGISRLAEIIQAYLSGRQRRTSDSPK